MYCPNGTEHETQYKCPRGTYSNQTQLENQEDCTPCPGGYYCDEEGQTEFTKQCSAGETFLRFLQFVFVNEVLIEVISN